MIYKIKKAMADNKKIIGFGIFFSFIFLVSVLILFFHLDSVNMCGLIDLSVFVPIIFYISFLFSFFTIILFNINKKRRKIVKFNISGFLMTLMFIVGIFVFIAINRYVPGFKAWDACLKTDMTNLQIAMEYYCDENGYCPKNIQELDCKIMSNPKRVKIQIEETDKLDTWYIKGNLYETEKRFPCKDVTHIVKTYYCNQNGCEFE